MKIMLSAIITTQTTIASNGDNINNDDAIINGWRTVIIIPLAMTNMYVCVHVYMHVGMHACIKDKLRRSFTCFYSSNGGLDL